MKVKFNHLERVAGLFVLSTILGGFAILVGVAVKQGWFETKVKFVANFASADGIRVGTVVQMAGLRAGSVSEVELHHGNNIHVVFEVSERFRELVRQDSVVRTLRPFVISEKILDVTIGDPNKPPAAEGAELPAEVSSDIMDLVSGKALAPYLGTISKMLENLRFIAESILTPERSAALVKTFDKLGPLVDNMTAMSSEAAGLIRETNHDHKLGKVVNNLLITTNEVNKMLPQLNAIVPELARLAPILKEKSPQLAEDFTHIANNVASLTDELQKTLPTIRELGPEIPRASRRAMEALDETVVTLKALQKSFLLSSNAREVRAEEAARDREMLSAKKRQPAAVPFEKESKTPATQLFCPEPSVK